MCPNVGEGADEKKNGCRNGIREQRRYVHYRLYEISQGKKGEINVIKEIEIFKNCYLPTTTEKELQPLVNENFLWAFSSAKKKFKPKQLPLLKNV